MMILRLGLLLLFVSLATACDPRGSCLHQRDGEATTCGHMRRSGCDDSAETQARFNFSQEWRSGTCRENGYDLSVCDQRDSWAEGENRVGWCFDLDTSQSREGL